MKIKKIDNQWHIETLKTKITINGGLVIRDFKIPGPGEFEIANVEVEMEGGIYNISTEDMLITYIDESKKNFTPQEIKSMEKSDILLLPVAGANTMDIKTAMDVISGADPAIVIPIYYDNIDTFLKTEGVKAETLNELKIAKQTITDEERKVIVLQ